MNVKIKHSLIGLGVGLIADVVLTFLFVVLVGIFWESGKDVVKPTTHVIDQVINYIALAIIFGTPVIGTVWGYLNGVKANRPPAPPKPQR